MRVGVLRLGAFTLQPHCPDLSLTSEGVAKRTQSVRNGITTRSVVTRVGVLRLVAFTQQPRYPDPSLTSEGVAEEDAERPERHYHAERGNENWGIAPGCVHTATPLPRPQPDLRMRSSERKQSVRKALPRGAW